MPESPTDDTLQNLIARAAEVRENAYAKYSGYQVGAALLTTDGRVFVGVNIENASYGLTNCAERSAIGAAVAAGLRPGGVAALAVVTQDGGSPCGACRQVMHEFGDYQVLIASVGALDSPQCYSVASLLPDAFELKA
ncbi:Cytidine deaminase [Posidoniimonas polymericola]|uniref:Cytidine deaminase n=1 Tax=Posidoniimonas polymericola TaxID=2528002 RepID=A0A5C5XUL1_9BACT|nr:cytidine deaminase [Posidoniimonas polymericola]TWT66996.1 Cytidine deaminase [Posidoniimonas polymericola]